MWVYLRKIASDQCRCHRQTCAKIPKMFLDPGSPGSMLRRISGFWILCFLVLVGSWDLRFCHGNIVVGSKGSWISDKKYAAGSRGFWVLPGQPGMGFCVSEAWTTLGNVTAAWIFFTSNDVLFLVTQVSVLLKLEQLFRMSTNCWFNHSLLTWRQAHLCGSSSYYTIMSIAILLLKMW